MLTRYFSRKTLFNYTAAILLMTFCACSNVAIRSKNIIDAVVNDAQILNEEQIAGMVGYYKLIKMELVDYEDGGTVIIGSSHAVPVYVDSRSTFFFVGVKTGIMVDSSMSFMKIDSQNVCTFEWVFDSTNKKVNQGSATIGEMKISGKSTKYGCIKERGFADLPSNLMPFKAIKYERAGDMLKIVGREDGISQTLYYVKVKKPVENVFGKL